jgi:hypothetical protein
VDWAGTLAWVFGAGSVAGAASVLLGQFAHDSYRVARARRRVPAERKRAL